MWGTVTFLFPFTLWLLKHSTLHHVNHMCVPQAMWLLPEGGPGVGDLEGQYSEPTTRTSSVAGASSWLSAAACAEPGVQN